MKKRFNPDKLVRISSLSVGRLVFTDGFCFVGSFVGQPEGDQAITLCGPLHLVTETSRALHCWDCATWPSGNSGYFFIVCCFVPHKTFSRNKTIKIVHLVPCKTFHRNQIVWLSRARLISAGKVATVSNTGSTNPSTRNH